MSRGRKTLVNRYNDMKSLKKMECILLRRQLSQTTRFGGGGVGPVRSAPSPANLSLAESTSIRAAFQTTSNYTQRWRRAWQLGSSFSENEWTTRASTTSEPESVELPLEVRGNAARCGTLRRMSGELGCGEANQVTVGESNLKVCILFQWRT